MYIIYNNIIFIVNNLQKLKIQMSKVGKWESGKLRKPSCHK